jgi:hypothetical protein
MESSAIYKEKVMKRLIHLLTILIVPMLFMVAQGLADEEGGLLYSCRNTEQSGQSWAAAMPYASINEVRFNEVQYVVPTTPFPPFNYTSKQFATKLGYNMLVGAHNGVPNYLYDANIFGKIDALMHPRDFNTGQRLNPINMRQLFFSPMNQVTTPMMSYLNPGGVGRVQPGGTFEIFLSAAQIKFAFGIAAGVNINLDAVALHYAPNDPNWPQQDQGIYLSLEGLTAINIIDWGAVAVNDGAILRIPGNCINYVASPYDGSAIVSAITVAGCGQIVCSEAADVDPMVANSGICDTGGVPILAIGDLDGLTLPESAAGYFTTNVILGRPVHHLWFSGLNLVGAGIVSTEPGGVPPMLGSIAILNGVPMAGLGDQVGLVTPAPPGVANLNGLALTEKDLSHFVMDTPTPEIGPAPLPITAHLQIGGAVLPAPAAGPLCVGLNLAAPVVDFGAPFPSYPGTFPELFMPWWPPLPPFLWGAPPVLADECANLSINFGPVLGPLAGQYLYAQSYLVGGAVIPLSAPLKLAFY